MEILRAGKLHSYVGPDSFLYVRNWVRPNGVEYYKCRKKTCSGRAIVKLNEFRATAGHNHEVDLEEVQRLKFKHKLQQRAAEEPISISEIYKQEASMIEGMTVQKFKSINKTMYRARAIELPPPPKTINELGVSLSDEKWKEKLVYAYGEEKCEFFKAHLESEDGSTQIMFMSPTFEDFARTGAPLRLHMDAAFKLKPACGEGTEYIVIHMYIGTISYPFVHMFSSAKSYFSYVTLMKFLRQFIPQINVEIFVSNDQESVEAAYTVFPKAVKSYYQQEEKDSKKDKDLTDLELYNKELTKQVGRPKPGIWRFIEVLKDIDYNKMSDYYRFRNKRVPNRYPVKTKEVEVQVDLIPKNAVKVNAIVQTVPPTNITEYFSEFKPDLSSSFNRTNNSSINSMVRNFKQLPLNLPYISASSTPKRNYQNTSKTLPNRTKSHTIIVKRSKVYNNENISPTKSNDTGQTNQDNSTEEVFPLNLDDHDTNDNTQLEVVIDPNDFPNKKIPSNVESAATEALKILKALKMEKSDKNPNNKKVIILNPKSLLNNKKNKIVKITKIKSLRRNEEHETTDDLEGEVSRERIMNEDSQLTGHAKHEDSRFLEAQGIKSEVINEMEEEEDSHTMVQSENSQLLEMEEDEEMVNTAIENEEIVMIDAMDIKGEEMVITETVDINDGEEVIHEMIEEHHEDVSTVQMLDADHDYST